MKTDSLNTAGEKGQRSLLTTLYSLLIMGRPADGAIIGGTVVLGMIAGTLALPAFEHMILGFFGGVLLLASMDTFNDYRDLEIDKISKPWRPLPQGLVEPRTALLTAIIEATVALTIGIVGGFQVVLVAISVVILAVLYSRWLKSYFIAKNIIVALSLSMASMAGYVAVARDFSLTFLWLEVLIFWSALVFEIHKDLGDIEGDLNYGVQTLPTRLGVLTTVNLLSIGYLMAWILATSFFLLMKWDLIYFVILLVTGLALTIAVILLFRDTQNNVEKTRRLTTAVMGLVLVGLGRLFIL
ncbi:MAG: UbiA family prenyltransferase [Candidatus Thorarchaeota archaeon]